MKSVGDGTVLENIESLKINAACAHEWLKKGGNYLLVN